MSHPLLVARLGCPTHPDAGLDAAGQGFRCRACGAYYPLVEGMPSFVCHDTPWLDDSQRTEMRMRDALELPLDDAPDPIRAPEVDAVRCALGDCRNLAVLNIGCNNGLAVPPLPRAALNVGVDFSRIILNKFQQPRGGQVELVHGDALHAPFRSGSFDAVVAGQMLNHLATPELREKFLREMVRLVTPGGRVILTAAHYNFRFKRLGKLKCGMEEGVFILRYTLDEFKAELAPYFWIEKLWGLWTYFPFTFSFVIALKHYSAYWDRLWRTRKLSLHYAKVFLAVCRPRSESV
jgi:SAM-dependent methyltransferase